MKPITPDPIKKIPTPSEDFPKVDTDLVTPLKVNISDHNTFEVCPNTPEDTPPLNLVKSVFDDPNVSFDFASPDEIEDAIKRNAELASNGFKLSNTEEEHLRPKVFDEESGAQLNASEETTEKPTVEEIVKSATEPDISNGWEDFGTGVRGCSQSFKPRADDDNHWKRLYFAQKGITAQLEKIIEGMQ